MKQHNTSQDDKLNDLDHEMLTREFRWIFALTYDDNRLLKAGRYLDLIGKLERRVKFVVGIAIALLGYMGWAMLKDKPEVGAIVVLVIMGAGVAAYFLPRLHRLSHLRTVVQQLPGKDAEDKS